MADAAAETRRAHGLRYLYAPAYNPRGPQAIVGGLVNIAIVGCGRVGETRARAAAASGHRVIAAVDRSRSLAERLAAQHAGCVAATDPQPALERDDLDLVVVATTNDALAWVTLACIESGKHVLVEKPVAR